MKTFLPATRGKEGLKEIGEVKVHTATYYVF